MNTPTISLSSVLSIFTKSALPFLLLFFCTYQPTDLKAQDSLSTKNLTPISYTFDVVDGQLTGKGADFLRKETAAAQYTMLGEYHGSKRISGFTAALIPELDKAGYKTMALEVGPNTGKVLNNLPADANQVVKELRQINQKYLIKEDDYYETCIPFFDKVEDALFLGAAKERGWNVMGIDQEYFYSFIFLADEMYNNLSAKDRKKSLDSYQKAIESLKQYYQADSNGDEDFSTAVKQSKTIAGFLNAMSVSNDNETLINDFNASINIYNLNSTRRWYENNGTRIRYMKEQLNNGLTENNFDLTKDKLLIKMGGYHMSKGFSPLALYEVGNTLNELAEFNGNNAISIGFINRFFLEKDSLSDAVESENKYYKNLRPFYAMGQKDSWVIIDLRPIRAGHYYHPVKYKINKREAEMIQRFDFLIIAPTDQEGENNFKKVVVDQKIQILNFGTFHMGLTSDANTTEFDERDKKNKEAVHDVAKMLKAFKPTVILVETPPSYDPKLKAEYEAYQKNPDMVFEQPSEIELLAYELGRLSGTTRIHGIDHKMSYNYRIGEEIENTIDPATYKSYTSNPFSTMPGIETDENKLTLLEKLKQCNNDQFLDFLITINADILCHAGTKDQFEGADEAAKYYQRNLRMYANLNRLELKKEDRVFILMGGSHTAFFRDFISRSPKYESVDVFEYLD